MGSERFSWIEDEETRKLVKTYFEWQEKYNPPVYGHLYGNSVWYLIIMALESRARGNHVDFIKVFDQELGIFDLSDLEETVITEIRRLGPGQE